MQAEVTPEGIANSIRMRRGQFKGVFLVVEGPSDALIYGRYVNDALCDVVPAFRRASVLEAIQILNASRTWGVLCVIDADFGRLEAETLPANTLRTDSHDLETMLLRSGALEKVLAELGSADKIQHVERKLATTVRDRLIEMSARMGLLRWVSLRERLDLSFDRLNVSTFFNAGDLEVILDRFVQQVFAQSRQSARGLSSEFKRANEAQPSPWQVACGHDFLALLSHALRKTIGTNDAGEVRPERLERHLRLAYEGHQFRSTDLYRDMVAWPGANGLQWL